MAHSVCVATLTENKNYIMSPTYKGREKKKGQKARKNHP